MIAYGRWDRSLVPAVGSRRRLQALMTLGWTSPQLADHLGWDPKEVWRKLSVRERVTATSAEQIAELYERLWDSRPPTPRSWQAVRAMTKTLNNARRRGWAPPMAWDDIDDPNERPKHRLLSAGPIVDEIAVERRKPGNAAERGEVIRQMTEEGLTADQIARQVGITNRAVTRIRGRAA